MEKIFSWKVLVSFCAVFIVTWILLQTVSNMRLESEAELIGSNVYSWNWPGENWQSRAEMTEASIIRKGDNDAVIKVSGKQQITALQTGEALDNSSGRSETVDCSAVLTLYRKSGKWVLGRVELPGGAGAPDTMMIPKRAGYPRSSRNEDDRKQEQGF